MGSGVISPRSHRATVLPCLPINAPACTCVSPRDSLHALNRSLNGCSFIPGPLLLIFQRQDRRPRAYFCACSSRDPQGRATSPPVVAWPQLVIMAQGNAPLIPPAQTRQGTTAALPLCGNGLTFARSGLIVRWHRTLYQVCAPDGLSSYVRSYRAPFRFGDCSAGPLDTVHPQTFGKLLKNPPQRFQQVGRRSD